MSEYPEHDKLNSLIRTRSGADIALSDAAQIIGEFIESSKYELGVWGCVHGYENPDECEESRYCRAGEGESRMWPAQGGVQRVLAEYFEVDQSRLEQEKQQMLEQIRQGAS